MLQMFTSSKLFESKLSVDIFFLNHVLSLFHPKSVVQCVDVRKYSNIPCNVQYRHHTQLTIMYSGQEVAVN